MQQKPVTASGAAAIAATAAATATTATGLQVGVGVGAVGQQHQRPVSLSAAGNMSPSQPATSLHRASTAPAGGAPCNTRITGPQPVDVSKRQKKISRVWYSPFFLVLRSSSFVIVSDKESASRVNARISIS